MNSTFTPVPYECREAIAEVIVTKKSGRIFFFNDENQVDSCDGTVITMEEKSAGIFIRMDSGREVRIDRVITLFGKPGAAYDEYDNFSNQCLACTGGYPL